MPDLAPALATKRFDLTRGVWGKVVVMHVALALSWAERIQFLRFAQSTKRCKGQDLSLSTGEQAGTMGARRNTDLAPNGADLCRCATIGAFAHTQNPLTDDGLFSLIKCFLD